MPKAQFIYVAGPTGVGKTKLSIELAQKLSWPIINCDSVQVYKYVDIGTAKPDPSELAQADHYLFDYVEPPQKQTAAQYIKDVKELIEKKNIQKAIFVGGSGFYIQALQKGLYPDSEVSDELKKEMDQWIADKGYSALYDWIQQKDPDFAQKISENDHYRIRRAVEVMKTQSLTMTELKQKMGESNFSPLPENRSLTLGLSIKKELLRPRIVERIEKMLAAGFIHEVCNLRDQGLKDWAPMHSVGYKEVQEFLDGNLTKNELSEKIVTSHMQLIKKQKTWFKKQANIQWFDGNSSHLATDYALRWVLDQELSS